ncbi:hypothetical protein [Thiocapsa sp. UBA6158]|jgi:hypothetical protein|uniref:hypothetical protein n=1 Tax=Thiocapsa sp. UBA6158 TaxID=1947692 RepID=UPI0025DB3171|nr:hypothetical protein [Thiocapsa sp. UBA6158]
MDRWHDPAVLALPHPVRVDAALGAPIEASLLGADALCERLRPLFLDPSVTSSWLLRNVPALARLAGLQMNAPASYNLGTFLLLLARARLRVHGDPILAVAPALQRLLGATDLTEGLPVRFFRAPYTMVYIAFPRPCALKVYNRATDLHELEGAYVGSHEVPPHHSGGEILRAGSPLPRLLETTAALGIPVRVNTNGWWGCARHIRIGERVFADADAVIAWLQDAGVAVLALSYDRRLAQYPGLWRSVVAVIEHGERRALPTELILTGVADSEAEILPAWLEARIGRPCAHLTIMQTDLVDLGGAARCDAVVTPQVAAERLRQTDCRLRGFYRPHVLHVGPDGGVRSCMMAAGAGWLGNLHQERLPALARSFGDNPVVRWFAANAARPSVPAHGLSGRHPCTVAVAQARVLEGRVG